MWLQVLVCLVAVTSLVTCEKCRPGVNCKAPNCRCWDDPNRPGNLPLHRTPQMVLVSFQYALNSANYKLYRSLLQGLNNPNGCPAKATYYVQKQYSDFKLIKELYTDHNEIGLTTENGTVPSSDSSWEDTFRNVKAELKKAGIPGQAVRGTRAPSLYTGGNAQMQAVRDIGATYDSSCSNYVYTKESNLLWPYTYDFVDGTPKCTSGQTVSKPFPGLWQFSIAALSANGVFCATPSSCSMYLKNAHDVFEMLMDAYIKHYMGSRAPFLLFVDALWLTKEYQFEGTRAFLAYVLALTHDTWVVSTQQSLEWIRDPVPTTNVSTLATWGCRTQV